MNNISKKTVSVILALILLLLGNNFIFAHPNMLDVGYDDCIPENANDGEDETWYWPEWNGMECNIILAMKLKQ